MPFKIRRRWKLPLLGAFTVFCLIDGVLFVVAIKYLCPSLPCYLSSPIAWVVFHLPLLITWLALLHTKPHIARCLLGAFAVYTLLGFLASFASQPVICILGTKLHWLLMFDLACQRYIILTLVLLILTFYSSTHFRQLVVFGFALLFSSTKAVHPQKLGYKDADQLMLPNDRDPKKPVLLDVRRIPRRMKSKIRSFTVLFLPGIGGHCCGNHKMFYDVIVKDLNWNLVLFDYRGYNASSKAFPTKSGLISDALAVYEWILSTGVLPSEIILWSHSLGTSVALNMLAELPQNKAPLAAILKAPFTRLVDVVRKHPFLELLLKFDSYVKMPIFDWLTIVTFFNDANLNFDSVSPLPKVHCPLLIIHAEDDPLVPIEQGRALFLRARKLQPAQVARQTSFYGVPSAEKCGHMILLFNDLQDIVEQFLNIVRCPIHAPVVL